MYVQYMYSTCIIHVWCVQEWILLESQLLSREVLIPVYLSIETDYLNEVYDKLISSVDWDNTAAAGKEQTD